MNIGRSAGVAGTVLALAIGITQSGAALPRAKTTDSAGTTTVTLITGDQVIIPVAGAARSTQAIRPATGRERMSFSSYTAGGQRYVLPADARRLVGTGRLDHRLFDIGLLLESGYDDASRATLPLIITYDGAARARIAAPGSTVTRDLPSINGSAVRTDKASAGNLWQALSAPAGAGSGVRKVWLDGTRQSTLDYSAAQIGAPAAWAAGYTGTGVKIAVLDTGVDQTHPDLAGQEIAEQNFTDAPDNVDRFGHGTHVASIAAGTAALAGGRYKGIAGMQWAADQGAKVANLNAHFGPAAPGRIGRRFAFPAPANATSSAWSALTDVRWPAPAPSSTTPAGWRGRPACSRTIRPTSRRITSCRRNTAPTGPVAPPASGSTSRCSALASRG